MKQSGFLVIAIILLLYLPIGATDERTITVTSSSILKRQVSVKANLDGKPTDLVCDTYGPYCSQPEPGEYRMTPAERVDAVYNDCTDVVLYKLSADKREKVGVYCWLGSGDCSISSCLPVRVEIFPATPFRHSWDILMGMPEAKDAASKMVGHCGDAETQDVMNACFALEFQNASHEMESTLEEALMHLDEKDKTSVCAAQKAWGHYRDLHCEAVGAIRVGVGSLEPTEINICKSELTRARMKEIKDSYNVTQQ